MRIYNSATHKKEEFQPIESGKVRMYVCGPTVYDNIHIGNARTFISFDVIRRWLIASGYEVTFAQNLTDVDDKIIKRANEQGRTAAEVATEFSDKFIGVMRAANVLDPDVRPRATKEIGPMIAMIETLIEQGHAYAADNGDVYFAVRSDPNYGQVSGRNIDDLMVGARIEENEDKNDPLDFALWKAAKPGEPSWPSPWGEGRPGWHTECAAMVHRYLGTPIDIHGGGSDLAFPHHENECAQATCAWHQGFSNTWMHTGMLLVDGEKMSKSLGNFFTLAEVLEQHSAAALRLLMLQTSYRSPLDFSWGRLEGAENSLTRIAGTVENLRWAMRRPMPMRQHPRRLPPRPPIPAPPLRSAWTTTLTPPVPWVPSLALSPSAISIWSRRAMLPTRPQPWLPPIRWPSCSIRLALSFPSPRSSCRWGC